MNRRILFVLASTAALAALVVAAAPAKAATTTANIAVSANVGVTCSMSSAPLAFGSYNPATNLDGSTNLLVTCTTGAVAYVTLDTTRVMTSGTNSLPFQLFTDAGRSIVWDAATQAFITGAGATAVPVSVYGRIPAGNNVPAGTYTATVVATLNY